MRKIASLVVLAVWFSATPAAASSILIVAADTSAPQAEMLARGFSTVDVVNAIVGTPTLAQLAAYDAVLAYTNFSPANGTALGDVLADYVDGGGQLTLATYSFSNPWAIGGRITTAGYSPLTNLGVNGDVSGSLVATAPADPLFNGVDLGAMVYFHNNNFSRPGLDPGATLLATDGVFNMIARNASGNVIGFNLFPGTGYGNNGEFYDLLANTLDADPTVPEPAILALLGVGVAGTVRRLRRSKP